MLWIRNDLFRIQAKVPDPCGSISTALFSIGKTWNSQFEQFPSRPKFKLFTSFEEAGTAVQKAENEFLALLKQKGYNTDTVNQPQPARAGDGLTTIRQDQLLLFLVL